jgi:predicted kinase
VAEKLGLTLLSKDEIKESLFDTVGWGDREQSRALSDAAYDLMFDRLEEELAGGGPVMLEANFRPEAAERLAGLVESVPYRAIQIRCIARREVLMERLSRRAKGKLRHPGHLDSELLKEAGALIEDGFVDLPGPVLEVDTSDPEKVNAGAIALQLAVLMSGDRQEKGV